MTHEPALLPGRIVPMLAVARSEPFDSPDHIFEVWWEGLRVAAYVEGGQVSFRTQSQLDLTPHFGDIAARLARRVHGDGLIFDAMLTAPDPKGVPRLSGLLRRIYGKGLTPRPGSRDSLQRDGEGRDQGPPEGVFNLQIFDILYRNYRSLFRHPLLRRKHTLRECIDPDEIVQLSHYEEGVGIAFYEAATRLGLPGAIAKEKTSLYQAGKRSPAWVQVLAHQEANVVIGGYTMAETGRKEPFGNLLMGVYTPEGLRYVGMVSGGFQREDMDMISALLKDLYAPEPAFVDPPKMGRLLYWCRPALAGRISYGEMTPSGQLQFAIFKGLRPDVEPRTCTAERLAVKDTP